MLEQLPEPLNPPADVPRASLVLAAGAVTGALANVWMGGAHSNVGRELDLANLRRAVVIDCAGDMPAIYRERAGRWFANVFLDLDSWPMHFDRLEANVAEVAATLHHGGETLDIYAMCTHGMNRSGLAAGLLLRAFGIEGPEAVRLIRLARPGALSNDTFRGIVAGTH